MKKGLFSLIMIAIGIGTAASEDKISLEVVTSSSFVDLRNASWVLREAFFAQEYNSDIVDYGSLLSDDCSFTSDDDEFQVRHKAPYYEEIKKNRDRVYRILTTISYSDITYDFNKGGYVFPTGFSVWSNQYYGDEAGKFFFKKGSYIPMPEETGRSIREELKNSYSNVKVVADIRIADVAEWTERKQHSELGKAFLLYLGADYRDVNRTWVVKHREVIVDPMRFQLYIDQRKVYDVAILSPAEKQALRNAGGSFEQYNKWSNYQGSTLTVHSYLSFLKAGVSTDAEYKSMLEAGATLDELEEMKSIGGTLPILIEAKGLGLSVQDYQAIKSRNGSLAGYSKANEAGCGELSHYLWALDRRLSFTDFSYICKHQIAPASYDSLIQSGHTLNDLQSYIAIKDITVSEFLFLKEHGISVETFSNWAPHTPDLEELVDISSYSFREFQQYNSISELSVAEFKQLKGSLVSLRTYQEWAPYANRTGQYPLISKNNADLQEYRYFKTFGKDLDTYLSELSNGWRNSEGHKQYKWDLRHEYLHPRRRASLFMMLGSGACVGLGFIMHAASDGLLSSSNELYEDFRSNPSSSTWDAYETKYNTYHVFLRIGDGSFYAAGGFAILSGIAFFVKEKNPHYISLNDGHFPDVRFTYDGKALGLTLDTEF